MKLNKWFAALHDIINENKSVLCLCPVGFLFALSVSFLCVVTPEFSLVLSLVRKSENSVTCCNVHHKIFIFLILLLNSVCYLTNIKGFLLELL